MCESDHARRRSSQKQEQPQWYIYFEDIYGNPSVETENKQAKYRGDFFSKVLEMFSS